MSRVYASLPLIGPVAGAGRDVLRGAQIALEGVDGEAPEHAAGHTTSTAYGRLAIVDGALVWDV